MVQWPVKMKHSFCLMVFAICLVVEYGRAQDSTDLPAYDQPTLKRVARQMPKPPPPPPPPQMPDMSMPGVRQKREAKGGGAMPTRKG